MRTLALATVELKEAPVACNIEGCWQTSTASRHSSIYVSIFAAKWSWEFLNRRLPTNFIQPVLLRKASCQSFLPRKSSWRNLLGKRKETATDNILIVQANIEQENTHTVNSTFAQHLNTHKQPWDTTIYHKQKTKASTTKPCRQRNPRAVEPGQAWTKKYYSEVAKSCTPAGVAAGDIWIPENNNTTTTWAQNLAGLPKFVSATYRFNHTGKTTEDTEEDSTCCNTWWGLHDQRRAREKGAGATRPAVDTRLKSRVTQSEMRKESIYRTRGSAPCLFQIRARTSLIPTRCVSHCRLAFKSILMQKKIYENSNISPCKI